ncbi:hypothetical protein BGZ60DRAFT_435013 [Tricladium varicosporioides]|nr:hypothetical protein BGZ60DRAFT_435013 [Hymenoscyphus varicosporioides]
MVFLFPSSNSNKTKESASDVRNRYSSRINNFLNQVDSYAIFRSRENALDNLFTWGRKIVDEKQKLDSMYADQKAEKERIEAILGELENKHATAVEQLKQLSKANAEWETRYNEKVANLTIDYTRELDEKERNHDNQINEMTESHAIETTKMKDSHILDLQKLHQEIKYKEIDHKDKIWVKENENKKLVQQLLINQDANLAWPDDKLKFHFQQLQTLVDSVVRKALTQKNQHFGQHLDPTDFIERAGNGKARFLLKSIIWKILKDQFFSVPYGFGALGSGQGYQALMVVYTTWRKIFKDHSNKGPESLAIFQHDEYANKWRSVTFQCISAELSGIEQLGATNDSPIGHFRVENGKKTIDAIKNVVRGISPLPDDSLLSQMEEEIQEISNLALKIALQFGINPAQLLLPIPEHGESIEIGAEFHETSNAASKKGHSFVVDLVTLPGIQKISAKSSEKGSKRVIIPCEIYPMAQSSSVSLTGVLGNI